MLRENDNVGSKGNCERINSIKRACEYNMLRIKKRKKLDQREKLLDRVKSCKEKDALRKRYGREEMRMVEGKACLT